ncbi:MAG: D-mannonate dehydratase ManD [Friedmanniella sp.]
MTEAALVIDRAQVIVASPGRNFVTLKLTTTDGLVGWGDGTLNGRELAVAGYLSEHVAPLLQGRDAHAVESTWQYLYRGAYWRGGPVTMAAIAAVDMALWDLKAKAAGLPLYQLLGGASRTGCLVYTHASGRDVAELLDSVAEHREQGYQAIRLQTAVPGAESAYGVASQTGAYEPAARGARPKVEVWDTRAYLRFIPSVFEAARDRFGPELALLHDVHHRLTPTEAVRLGRSLEPYDLFWLEDYTPAENQALLRQVRAGTTIPLAIGEIFTSPWDANLLITERLIDYLRACVTHAGGITGLRKMLGLAELYGVKSGCHGPTDVSPISLAAALHLGLALHNFGIQEHMPHSELTDEAFPHAYRFADGMLHPGDEPGLGVQLDEDLAARHPYERAYLPVARLRDGTVHDW